MTLMAHSRRKLRECLREKLSTNKTIHLRENINTTSNATKSCTVEEFCDRLWTWQGSTITTTTSSIPAPLGSALSKHLYPAARSRADLTWDRLILLLFVLGRLCALTAAQDINLNGLSASQGFRILGAVPDDRSAGSVSNAGDVNGDNIDDVLIGAYYANSPSAVDAGTVYVIFGRNVPGGATAFSDIPLPGPGTSLAATVGFRIFGAVAEDRLGISVNAAGDVNNDGISDIIVGAYLADPPSGVSAGISYVIFGRSLATQATHPFGDIQLPTTTMSANVGFRIIGAAANDYSGWSVSGAGDVNGDHIDDVIVGAYSANAPNGVESGISYVIFGRNIPGSAAAFGDIQLTTGTNTMSTGVGFRILGASAGNGCGHSVSAAGDVNGDGVGDVIIGAYYPNSQAGISYVIFGRSISTQVSFPFSDVQLSNTVLPANTGFLILGSVQDDNSGWSVSTAGDFNGDGISDLIVGARYADTANVFEPGIVYLIFGRNVAQGAAPFGSILLADSTTPMAASIGFRIIGVAEADSLGFSVKYAHDVNGDGISDIIIGACLAGPSTSKIEAGITYVIFGRNLSAPGASPFTDILLSNSAMDASIGFRILGAAPADNSGSTVSAAGDVNGDGVNDVIIGAEYANIDAGDDAGTAYVVFGIPPSPTSQPTSKPSRQPSRQPSAQPSRQPFRQPSSQPTNQPQGLPSSQPSRQPSVQPSSQPSAQPSAQPSRQPSAQPTGQPSGQPSTQPTLQPSAQPTGQPFAQPTTQPSSQPFSHPSAQPTVQPSRVPSLQPSGQPSNQPSAQPSRVPSTQPSREPSCVPSTQPTGQPTEQPSLQPTSQPSSQPSRQPLSQPSAQPSVQPSVQPSDRPSGQPSMQPSLQPTSLPSGLPTVQPTLRPSAQTSSVPSCQPSTLPSGQPSSYPTVQPSNIPSEQPSSQPTGLPSSRPSAQPSRGPSCQPTSHPSAQRSDLPTSQPSTQPSHQPSVQPSNKPSGFPTAQPTRQPSSQPSHQPVTSQPSVVLPTSRPIGSTILGEWVMTLSNMVQIDALAILHDALWACGLSMNVNNTTAPYCATVRSESGEQLSGYSFPWNDITSVFLSRDATSIVVSGRNSNTATEIAVCEVLVAQLTCSAKSLFDTNYMVGSYVSAAAKIVYLGSFESQLFTTVVHLSTNTISGYHYTTSTMETVNILHAHSPPSFSGSFLAGTCTGGAASLNYICAGVVRAASGTITAFYITPTNRRILNSAELANAMVQEVVRLDSFIAGGLELSDGTGMHAYVVRVNSLFYSVLFGIRYRLHTTVPSIRRVLQDTASSQSVVKGMALLDTYLYMIVSATESTGTGTESSMHVLKTDIATGHIVQQVQIYSSAASLSCTDITSTGLYLTMSCKKQSIQGQSRPLLISMDRNLTLSQLPTGFMRYENNTFTAELVPFSANRFQISMQNADRSTHDYAFTTTDGNPSFRQTGRPTTMPTLKPSSSPSGQPSSRPTSAPSVSPQPTSHPSSSGPTNTYKPTVKPTQRPSIMPSRVPSVSPSVIPSVRPTTRPSAAPCVAPSAQPSVSPTKKPTFGPTTRSTRVPSIHPVVKPTSAPSVEPSATTAAGALIANNKRAFAIFGYVVLGLFGLWSVYFLRWWCRYKLEKVQSDANRTLYGASMGSKLKPRHPIFRYMVSHFVTIVPAEVGFIDTTATNTADIVETSFVVSAIGANIEGSTQYTDLEANTLVGHSGEDLQSESRKVEPYDRVSTVVSDVDNEACVAVATSDSGDMNCSDSYFCEDEARIMSDEDVTVSMAESVLIGTDSSSCTASTLRGDVDAKDSANDSVDQHSGDERCSSEEPAQAIHDSESENERTMHDELVRRPSRVIDEVVNGYSSDERVQTLRHSLSDVEDNTHIVESTNINGYVNTSPDSGQDSNAGDCDPFAVNTDYSSYYEPYYNYDQGNYGDNSDDLATKSSRGSYTEPSSYYYYDSADNSRVSGTSNYDEGDGGGGGGGGYSRSSESESDVYDPGGYTGDPYYYNSTWYGGDYDCEGDSEGEVW